MATDEKTLITENTAPDGVVQGQVTEPDQDTPLTQEQFAAQMQRLAERARAAGLNPLQTMAQTYARRGMAILEGLLASLESDDSSKKKRA
mgnify:CR=1 FL=1